MSNNIFDVKGAEFDAFLEKHEFVACDFWAKWCSPCRMLNPIWEKLAKEFQGKVTFAKVDFDENPEIVIKHQVNGIPNICLFYQGKLIDRLIGFQPIEALEVFLNKHILAKKGELK